MRLWWCRLRGHRWDNERDWCSRCDLTAEAIRRGRDRKPTWADVDDAYLAGATNGSAFAQGGTRARVERAYLLGQRRGQRHALHAVSEIMLRRQRESLERAKWDEEAGFRVRGQG